DTKRAQLVRSMLIAPPKPTKAPDPDTLAAVSPATVRVVVENGTNVPGMARRVADILRREGFQIADVGNAPTPNVAMTEVHEHTSVANAGLKVRAALGAAAKNVPVISESASKSSDVTIILGEDLVTAFNVPTQ
ncbi:MAG TPA: LytR C-terminal domain-containing protein, partial [Candidatus Rubrimentiphilum sp.]|nr:LytR C-terminal domain-containing protein [Candidatus Rubrimentiphilum sp.]